MLSNRLRTRRLAVAFVVAVISVGVTAQPAAAELTLGEICGSAEDLEGNKHLMRMVPRSDGQGLTCAVPPNSAPLPATPSTPSTIQSLFGSVPGHLQGEAREQWCSDRLFRNSYRVPVSGSHPAGTSDVVIGQDSHGGYHSQRIDDPIVDFADLRAGEIACVAGLA